MIRLSLTTTPVSATNPNIDIIDTFRSRKMCPQTAPIEPERDRAHDDERLHVGPERHGQQREDHQQREHEPPLQPADGVSRCSAMTPSNVKNTPG